MERDGEYPPILESIQARLINLHCDPFGGLVSVVSCSRGLHMVRHKAWSRVTELHANGTLGGHAKQW